MDLDTRLRAYATTHRLTLAAARDRLITIALDHLEARAAGGRAAHAGTTAAERSSAASCAAHKRWAAYRRQHHSGA